MAPSRGGEIGSSGSGERLSLDPGFVQCPATSIFRKHETICSGTGTFARMHGGSQADSEAVRFYLNFSFHQYKLKGPAL